MAIDLYVAPPAAGKTSWCVDLVRRTAAGLARAPYVVVGGALQVADWQRRLAAPGPGTLGVRVSTFHRLYADCLAHCGAPYALIGDTVQFRLLRILLDRLPLERLDELADRPGLVSSLQEILAELRSCLVDAANLREMVGAIAGPARLRDLAAIYAAYEEYLALHEWTDEQGLGHLALEALTGPAPWPLVVADGFDDLTPLEAAFLRRLAECGARVVVAVTAPPAGAGGLLGRLPRERLAGLAERLGAEQQTLPSDAATDHATPPTVLRRLRTALFAEDITRSTDPDGALTLVEAPDRIGEVRAALRWLKARLRERPDRPTDLGLLVRRLEPYRAAIAEVAEEYGLPVRIAGGRPLAHNPAVAALLSLLRTMVPLAGPGEEPALPRRAVVEVWRSPYFCWSCAASADDPTPVGIRPEDARVLDAAARAGRAIRGLSQWQEALDLWAEREDGRRMDGPDEDAEEGTLGGEDAFRVGCPPAELRARFRRFVVRMTPPVAGALREYVRWVEDLIGPDPLSASGERPPPPDTYSLRMVQSIREACGEGGSERGEATLAQADLAALQRFKEVLRGLVWAEEALGVGGPMDFGRFLQELAGAVDSARYEAPARGDRGEIMVAEVQAAAGVAFRALAVLGLAEGEFPASHRDDPFLTDGDRLAIREYRPAYRLPLRLESREVEAFCRVASSAWERLLLTRPRLSETGAAWAPSPYWEEVRRQVDVRPRTLTADAIPEPDEVCSWPELLASLAGRHDAEASSRALDAWLASLGPAGAEGCALVDQERAARAVHAARGRRALGPFDGDLTGAAAALARRYAPEKAWSASRLEAYRTCPLSFWVGSVLGLEPRPEPAEGPDARQLGNLYHRILEEVYRAGGDDAGRDDRDGDACDSLLAALPEVARRVLDAAPQVEGFRETPWWLHTRTEIEENVRRTIVALAEMADGFRPLAFEARFFAPHELYLEVDGVCLRVHGLIDRVDVSADGRLRVIDYKTAGPTAFTRAALERGDKLQLPLYALAARDALGLGEPVDGFYWHVPAAKPSPARLARCDGGASAAMERATRVAAEVAAEVVAGRFPPRPPAEGCPPYCAAEPFCWHYRARRG